MRRGPLLRILMGIVLCGTFVDSPEPAWSVPADPTKLDCAKQDDAKADFKPRAFTLSSMYVRTKAPEYSFVRGQWVLGDAQGVLPANTCLQVLRREDIGVIQVWYWVRYKDAAKQIRTGWIWAGTKNKDEGSYVGGDTPSSPKKGAVPPDDQGYLSAWSLLSVAYAQADLPPLSTTVSGGDETMLPKHSAADADYLVELPFVGWAVSFSTISAMVLFVVMLAGMVAKGIWDETGGDKSRWPSWDKMFRPFLVSPIAFSAFWGPMYLQSGGGLSLTMTLYAFQIGFMWQHVLEKKGSGVG